MSDNFSSDVKFQNVGFSKAKRQIQSFGTETLPRPPAANSVDVWGFKAFRRSGWGRCVCILPWLSLAWHAGELLGTATSLD